MGGFIKSQLDDATVAGLRGSHLPPVPLLPLPFIVSNHSIFVHAKASLIMVFSTVHLCSFSVITGFIMDPTLVSTAFFSSLSIPLTLSCPLSLVPSLSFFLLLCNRFLNTSPLSPQIRNIRRTDRAQTSLLFPHRSSLVD